MKLFYNAFIYLSKLEMKVTPSMGNKWYFAWAAWFWYSFRSLINQLSLLVMARFRKSTSNSSILKLAQLSIGVLTSPDVQAIWSGKISGWLSWVAAGHWRHQLHLTNESRRYLSGSLRYAARKLRITHVSRCRVIFVVFVYLIFSTAIHRNS